MSLKRLRQQWATDIMRGPFLPVDLDVILEQQGTPPPGPPRLTLDIGPPITDLSEGMDEPAASSSATAAEPVGAESRSSAGEAAAEASRSGEGDSVERQSALANGKSAEAWKEAVSTGDKDVAHLGVQNGAASVESAAESQVSSQRH